MIVAGAKYVKYVARARSWQKCWKG